MANPNVIAAFTDLGNNITSVGSNPPPADPQVGPLADNGGTTFTRALIAGSAAIDAGNNCILTNACSPAYGSNITTDQRGNVRPQDGDGNGSSIVDIGAYESANIAPTVISINRANANPTNAASVDFTVTFSESVTGGGTSNFSTTTTSTASGAISGVTGSGATRTVTVSSITGEGTLRLNMANSNGVTDSDGAAVSNLPFTTGQVYTIDRIAPDTTILTNPPSLTNSTSAVFTFSGTDVGTGVASFECKLDAGSFTACVSGQSYSSLSSASHTFQVRAIDNVGNVDASPASYTWTVDAIAPSVTINQAAGQADPTNTSPILFTVVFNEPVTGFTSNSGDVVLSGASGANAYTVSGGPSTYTVSVTGMNANGNVTATVPVGAAFDAAGNGNAASTSTDNSVTFVATIPTTTVINSDLPDPSGVGQAVTVNYTVAAVGPPPPVNGPSVPTPIPGNVTVTDSLSAATCTATAAAGTCNIVLPNAGARTLTATYGGSGNYLVSSGTAAHLVDGPPAAAATAANVVTPGAATYTFTVTYTDDIAMNVSTLDGGDVRITGPASFNAAATFVSVNLASNGTPRTATYSIVPPGGTWDGIDNGAYSVVMQGSQVADTFGNFVPAGTIGGFIVNIPTISISGNIKQYVAGGPNTNLAGVTVTLSGSSAATTPTDASGNYSFANLISGGSFVVTPTLTGKVFEPITRTYNGLATNVTNADFVAYTDPGGVPRNLKVVNSFVVPGQTVSVPVVLTSLGNEAFVSFSLAYDSNLFSINPTAVCGANAGVCSVTVNNTTPGTAGVTVTPAALFTAGQQEVVRVMFQSLATNASNTPITFGSSPVAKLIKDANNNPLPSTYTDGLVVFTQGLESDIATRNTGDGQLLATDMPLIRQAVVGTLVLNPAFNEFQRVDSAPIATKGDGQLDSTDIVIARRYVARIEEPQTAGGPTQPLAGAPEPLKETADAPTYGRRVHIVSANATPGGKAAIPVEMDIQGDEVATSFTLDFDPSKLTNPVVTLGSGTPKSATLTTNIAEKGKLGILVDSAEVFAGRQILTITFDIAADAGGGATPIIFTNALAAASVSDGIGGQLTTRYEDGAVTISGTAASLVSISGRVVTPDGRGLRNATVSITDQNGATRRTTTGAFGHYNFDAIAPGRNYRIAVASRQYRFAARTIEVVDNLSDVDFTGSE